LAGITIAVADPEVVAARWAEVLGVTSSGEDGGEAPGAVSEAEALSAGGLPAGGAPVLRLDGGEVRFEATADERAEGLVEIALELPHELPGGAEAIELGGVWLRRV
ncbi:MAG: hypothetical protein JWN10_2048, partial [Solirubrobacterales bacterium]|nr:hypothetical protein [Solirubrobacterales bacterium]